MQEKNLMSTLLRGVIDLSGAGGSWDGPSHNGNVYLDVCSGMKAFSDHPDFYN